MKILRRDTATEIRKTTEAAAQAAAKLVTMREERAKALLQTDDLTLIKKSDEAVADQERTIAVLQDRLRALEARRRQERQDAREKEKFAALAAFEKAQRARTDAAVAVIEAFAAVADAYLQYKEICQAPLPWPDVFPRDQAYSHYRDNRNLPSIISGAFYLPALLESHITQMQKRSADVIERMRASDASTFAGLSEAPIPQVVEPEGYVNG